MPENPAQIDPIKGIKWYLLKWLYVGIAGYVIYKIAGEFAKGPDLFQIVVGTMACYSHVVDVSGGKYRNRFKTSET